jgi:hypothetical protein
MGAEYSGPELERTLIARIEEFLRAMGGMLAFMVIWLGDVVGGRSGKYALRVNRHFKERSMLFRVRVAAYQTSVT